MTWCLNKNLANDFLEKLKNGEIDPDKLITMTSTQRRNFFAEFLGIENAKNVNALFESKLLLKNQKQGIITWAKKVSGLSKDTEKDIITQVNKLEKALSPKQEKDFLEDLARKKIGLELTDKEAKEIYRLAKKAEDLKQFPEKRIEYGNALLDFIEYTEELAPTNKNIFINITNLPKTLKATMDLSAPFRQGWGMMSRKEWYTSFGSMFKYAISKKSFKDLQADIISRKTYPLMKKSGLRISSLATKLSQREEAFMSTYINKIPIIKASERAYVGFLNKLRADVFDSLVESAIKAGEDVTPSSEVTRALANVVNDFTGSGNIGTGDKYSNVVPLLNGLFFSPRKISATINMVNPKRYISGSKTARKAALRQLIGSLSISAIMLGMAKAFNGDVESDPRSSDFGKIKLNNTRFDVTGGNGSYAVLLARLLTNQTKSTLGRKKIKDLGEGYKPVTRGTLISQNIRNKLSPLAGEVVTLLTNKDFLGRKPELKKETRQLFEPIIISSIFDLIKDDPDNLFLGILAEMFGISAQTYK